MPQGRKRKAPCAQHGCPVLTYDSRCPDHTLTVYGHQHRATRTQWARKVDAGGINCARCNHPIQPGTPWHLDHADDRTTYLGPSHAHCNSGHHVV